MSKNIQVIDSAINATYDIFTVADDDFMALFPNDGQDVEFAEDFFARMGDAAQDVWGRIWSRRVEKKQVQGIHGTLFCGLDLKKRFYPTKRESEMTTGLS